MNPIAHRIVGLTAGLVVAACGDDTIAPPTDATAETATGNDTTADTEPGADTASAETAGSDDAVPADTMVSLDTYAEPDDSTHAPGFWPPTRYTDLFVRGGSRLTAHAVVSGEGNTTLLRFRDRRTGEGCAPRETVGGVWRCLPLLDVPA